MNKEKSHQELLNELTCLKEENMLLKKIGRDTIGSISSENFHHPSPLGIIDWDLNFKVLSWNKSASSIFGFSEQEAIGTKGIELIVSKDDRELIAEVWSRLLENSGGLRSSNWNTRKDGDLVFCEWYNTPLLDDNNKLLGVKSFIIDNTEAKKTEQLLIDSELRYKSLSQATFEAIVILDAGYCIEANEACCELLGYAYHELIGMYALEVIDKGYKEIVADNINNAYSLPYEACCRKKDDTKIEVEIQGKSIQYKDKTLRVTALREITHRKRIEQELKENEHRFRTIFEHAGDGFLIGNNKGQIIDTNTSFCLMTGYKKEEIINQHISFLFSEETLKNNPLKFDVLNDGKSLILEREIIGKNGNSILIEMNSKRLNENYLISVIRDLSYRLKAENELRETNKQLLFAKEKAEESDQLKSEFLANMSHEIRTPMNGILGFAEMLNEADIDKETIKHYTNIIINGSHQLKQIIDDILEISVLETKQVKVVKGKVCLNNLLLEIFSVYDKKAKDNRTPLYIHKDLSDRKSTIFTDIVKLQKIIHNLIDNALHYTNTGYIELGYLLKEDKLEFYVRDTGVGIGEDKQELIFERFSQGDKSLSRKFGGLGLGLSIAKENTELLGGSISVESKLGEGSRFCFSIDYDLAYTDEEGIGSSITTNAEEENHKILIAEDEEVNFLYYNTVIDKMSQNCVVLHAKNGLETVNICKENKDIKLVLMDIKMPEMSGIEATRKIREFNTAIKIIAQSAYTSPADKAEAIEAGCNEFITKPIEKTKLQAIIGKYLLETD